MEKTFRNCEDQYSRKIFANQLITVEDLKQFKKQLMKDPFAAIKSQPGIVPKKWMKPHEVRKFLKISPGTLQTLKSSGIIPYTKIGSVNFYAFDDIENTLQFGKINSNCKMLR